MLKNYYGNYSASPLVTYPQQETSIQQPLCGCYLVGNDPFNNAAKGGVRHHLIMSGHNDNMI